MTMSPQDSLINLKGRKEEREAGGWEKNEK